MANEQATNINTPQTENPHNDFPLFLGICPRAQFRGMTLDLIGVTTQAVVSLLPQALNQWFLVVAYPYSSVCGTYRVIVTREDDANDWGFVDLATTPEQAPTELTPAQIYAPIRTPAGEGIGLLVPLHSSHILIAINGPPIPIHRPGSFKVEFELGDKRKQIGSFIFHFLPPPPISDDERRGILSRPGTPKYLSFGLDCKICKEHVDLVAALDGRTTGIGQKLLNPVSLLTAGDNWECKCKKSVVPLSFMKESLPGIFREGSRAKLSGGSIVPLYERVTVTTLATSYQELIQSSPTEEAVQQFLEKHPILWSFLSPVKILHKPSILSKRKADFGILSSGKILHLVEIEKPQTKLAKQDRGIHSELQAGFDQIRDWRVVVQDHRDALLSELGLSKAEVDDIRFILLAGLTSNTAPDSLMTLRRDRVTDAQIFCFDELTSFLMILAAELSAY